MWKKYGFKQSSLYKNRAPKDNHSGHFKAILSDVGLRSVLECVEAVAVDKGLDELGKDKLSKHREQQRGAHTHSSMKLQVKSRIRSRLMQNRMHTKNGKCPWDALLVCSLFNLSEEVLTENFI